MKSKFRCVVLLIVISICFMSGCREMKEKTQDKAVSRSNTGQVYYLNAMTELESEWEELAKEYTKQTGTKVKVVTAASNQYEATLKSEMEKELMPTIFVVNGYDDISSWSEYCYDLRDCALCKNLSSGEFSLRGDDGEALAVAYDIESYGIIYNKELLSDYCTLEGAVISSSDEIRNFDVLREVAEDIQGRKESLGVKGAFASFGLESDSVSRFTLQLANVPVYYELKSKGDCIGESFTGEYLFNLKEVWDMYMNNSTCEAYEQISKTLDDSIGEFARGEAVFIQSDTKIYESVVKEDIVAEDAFGMLPLYIGIEGEESQGLCTGSETYWCVNSKAKAEDINASVAFLEWVITSDKGKELICEKMGLNPPFTTVLQEEKTQNPLSEIGDLYIDRGYVPVTWYLNSQTNRQWQDGVSAALVEYTQGVSDWAVVEDAFCQRLCRIEG